MTDNPDDGFKVYTKLLLESITNLSCHTEELKKQYAALDKTFSLLKQAYEANLLTDRQTMTELITQVKRLSDIVEGLSCREHAEKIGDFQERIRALEAGITPSRWAANFIGQFFQKMGWIFGALIVGTIGYLIYQVSQRCCGMDE